ncbi:CHAT domain-containing protein [Laspinema olomoucense]|uniref:CHAT domain-containing protein n=1 Tax=Laspinema olomoucense TaxID=3231600 RepID=UPI0021BB462E|nr:tetratricopeptide repeat protein [Laspinema sp. D3a]MCT7988414.1 tetratricopeptide repeat protein [Laspinema sp. D3a]
MHFPFSRLTLIPAIALLSVPASGFSAPFLAQIPPVNRSEPSSELLNDTPRLLEQGIEQFRQGDFQTALQTYQQVLQRHSLEGDRLQMAAAMTQIGEVYTALSDYTKALEQLEAALTIRQELNDRPGVGETLNHIGFVYSRLGDYPQALQQHEQALEIARTLNQRPIEGEALHHIAAVYAATGEYQKAVQLYQEALVIRQEVGDKRDEGRTLNNLGGVYYSLGEAQRALDLYEQALKLREEVGDRAGVARLLSNIGLLYRQFGQGDRALSYYEQALPILTEIGDKSSLGNTLNGLGVLYEERGEYQQALSVYNQSLALAEEIGDRPGMSKTLDNVGGIYYSLGQYPQALTFYERSLSLRQSLGDRPGMGTILNNLGGLYYSLGEYPQALELLQQALTIRQEIGDKSGESRNLDAIAIVHEKLGQYTEALDSYQQALEIANAIGDPTAQGNALEHIGGVYLSLGQTAQSLEFLQQALQTFQRIGDRVAIGRTLNGIASVYYRLKQYPQSLEFLQQSLKILRETGDKAGEAIALANLGRIFQEQEDILLATAFYKKAVNLHESTRQNLRVLSIERQQSFTETVADTYRHLSDLLLRQNRILEAQQVLDLLKIQELDEYLQNVQGNEQTASGVQFLPEEEKLAEEYLTLQEQAIELGQELSQLKTIPETERTPQQQERIAELEGILQTLRQKFDRFIESPEIIEIADEIARQTSGENLDLTNIAQLQTALQQLNQKAVLLYPLILEDRIELILITPDTPPIHRSVAVNKANLSRGITEFRTALTVPSKRANSGIPKIAGKQLYNWLIQPFQSELDRLEVETIIYAPDGLLRYIPLAALYDGEKWLAQRYQINNITAASLTNFNVAPPEQLKILAGAFTQGTYSVEVGTRQLAFSGLPFAGKEVENLAATIPGTMKLIDLDFNRSATTSGMSDRNVIHLATHAAFVNGQPEDSFIMLGDGDRITLRDLEQWSLPNVDLIVLSACQTAMGGQMGDGTEILGFGYQMQKVGAKAAIASLWSVDDGGTQALMTAFYNSLKTGENKTAALQKAQLALLESDYSHPYYWASFILIGNGF